MHNVKIMLSILSILLTVTGCRNSIIQTPVEGLQDTASKDNTSIIIGEGVDTQVGEVLPIYGVWILEQVVLRSEMYSDDITKNGEIIPVDVEDYLGYEVEYAVDFFRLGETTYLNPIYTQSTTTVDNYEEGGRFRLTDNFPSIQEFFEDKKIELDGIEDYVYLGDFPLIRFDVGVDPHIPVGSKCVVLNTDTILVGTWGKIILASRVTTSQ